MRGWCSIGISSLGRPGYPHGIRRASLRLRRGRFGLVGAVSRRSSDGESCGDGVCPAGGILARSLLRVHADVGAWQTAATGGDPRRVPTPYRGSIRRNHPGNFSTADQRPTRVPRRRYRAAVGRRNAFTDRRGARLDQRGADVRHARHGLLVRDGVGAGCDGGRSCQVPGLPDTMGFLAFEW